MNFDQLGLLPQLLEAVTIQGYTKPSPIQEKAIPEVLAGKDVMAAAQTGTGKTAGFTLPLLDRLAKGQQQGVKVRANQARALVLTPTRELAAQVSASVETYGQNLSLKSAVVFGGVKINPQMQKLRGGVDVLIATPGRLLDLHQQNAINFDQLEVLVLDEADRMLDMGFLPDIRRILKVLPQKRQTLLFSATFAPEIRELAKNVTNNPIEISVAPANSTVDSVDQWVYPAEKAQKTPMLQYLIEERQWAQVLVFVRTKHGANRLVKQLVSKNINASAIHGNKSQGARTKALSGFKQGDVQVLVATDIAARGLDIEQLPQVINFDLPSVPADYVHRIGRTGRAGATGVAISLVSHDEHKQLLDIERLIKKVIPREEIEGFEPLNQLPASRTDFSAKPSNHRSKPKGGGGNSSGNRSRRGSGGGQKTGGQGKPSGKRPDQRSSGSGRGNDGQPKSNSSRRRNTHRKGSSSTS